MKGRSRILLTALVATALAGCGQAPGTSPGPTTGPSDAPTSTSAGPSATPVPTPTAVATPLVTPVPMPIDVECTYHVSPGGDDGNAGTEQAPWGTVQHAADTVTAGDAVCLASGDYAGQGEVFLGVSGTAEAPIIFAAPAGLVTVSALTLRPGTSHVRLVGLTVQGFRVWGVTLLGSNEDIVLSHLGVFGGEAGIRLTEGNSGDDPAGGPVSDVVVEDSVIRDSQFTAVDCTPGPCDRTTFRRLEVSGAGLAAGFGGDGIGLERGRDVVVEDCYVHDNGGDGIDLNSRDTDGNVPGILVRRNRVIRNHLQGIKLWAGGRMENNVVTGQGIDPVLLGVHPGVFEVVNNTIAYNMYSPDFSERDYAFVAAHFNPDLGRASKISLTLVNNLFAFNTAPGVGDVPTGVYFGPGVTLTEHHNLYWSREDGEIAADFVKNHDPMFARSEIADGTWADVTGQGAADITADPLLTAGWPELDLHLGAGSPAIDAGSSDWAPADDAQGKPRSGAPDIGAYER